MNDKCERWRLKLQSYDFTIKHIKGTSNTMSDYLSRSPVDHADDDIDNENHSNSVHPTIKPNTADNKPLPTSSIISSITIRSQARTLSLSNNNKSTQQTTSFTPNMTLDDLRIDYNGDITQLKAAQKEDGDLRHIMNNLTNDRYIHAYIIQDDLLMHRSANNKLVPCVPKGKIRQDIMKIDHDTPANGAHLGRDKTIQKIKA